MNLVPSTKLKIKRLKHRFALHTYDIQGYDYGSF